MCARIHGRNGAVISARRSVLLPPPCAVVACTPQALELMPCRVPPKKHTRARITKAVGSEPAAISGCVAVQRLRPAQSSSSSLLPLLLAS